MRNNFQWNYFSYEFWSVVQELIRSLITSYGLIDFKKSYLWWFRELVIVIVNDWIKNIRALCKSMYDYSTHCKIATAIPTTAQYNIAYVMETKTNHSYQATQLVLAKYIVHTSGF